MINDPLVLFGRPRLIRVPSLVLGLLLGCSRKFVSFVEIIKPRFARLLVPFPTHTLLVSFPEFSISLGMRLSPLRYIGCAERTGGAIGTAIAGTLAFSLWDTSGMCLMGEIVDGNRLTAHIAGRPVESANPLSISELSPRCSDGEIRGGYTGREISCWLVI